MSSRGEHYTDEIEIASRSNRGHSVKSAIMAELNDSNHEDWKIWYMTELIAYTPVREWVLSDELPDFSLPRRSRELKLADKDGKDIIEIVFTNPDWEGEDGK